MALTTTTTKVGPKFQVVIPKKLREQARLRVGDFLRAELRHEGILLKPAVLVERDPEVEADIAASEADLKAGRVLGPFQTVAELRRALKEYKAKMAADRRRSRGKESTPSGVGRRTHARASD